ncbi:MAG TPA: hypothetical protein VHV78_12405, partial [Gemmatimonadaceae bacterium]|nr:hypothetical protein [Gemmatimonadaceae bacterium]
MAIAREIFRQYDIRGIVGQDLTPDVANAVGKAYAAYLFLKHPPAAGAQTPAIAVGRDN